ncbi:cuticle protein 8-like [Trichoplusia ni]|uniref:Cuticle protein 8-like n=1 Tax=Trichoplusia ni TaxID=7111 RepID=A0A7E5WG81_TRINI|nr:cuticle protein 8-like [Trichoplusia ni]
MFAKVVALCAFVAAAQAGLLAAPAHYSPAEAVSSQSIVRHDQAHAAPLAKIAVAAPVTYHAAPVSYHATPAHYSSAAAVSSQNIVRHDQPAQHIAVAAPVAYHAAPAVATYHAAPAPAVYHAAPAHVAYHAAPVVAHAEDFDAHPKYEYNYSVADGHTGDNKSQQESRDGDVVKGSYSFHEADGSIRTVEYSADDHSGFNAVVHNTAPTAAPVVVKATPVILKAAPAHYYHH